MYVRAGRPAFARPCVGVHKSTSLMSSSLLLQQSPAYLVRLTWIVFVIRGRCPYSWCLVGCSTMTLVNSLILAPDDSRNVWLNKRESHPKIYRCHQKKIWQMEFRMTNPPSLYLSLVRPVIVNICIINASTVEPKCRYSPDRRRSQTFRNSFIFDSTSVFAPCLRKVKTNIWKKEKNAYFCQQRK